MQAPNQNQNQLAARPTAQQKGKNIVINTVIGGLYLAGHSSKALDQYVNAAKQHLEVGECSNPEDSIPVKQQKMMTDDVVFRERESIGVHAPTEDPLVITIP
ncbi:hypothetical protein, partial [Salmonella sp. s60131]|uniref:hypothetical protein n=1 Tax=Salmonella sp. s60131 TaxID=3159722 RepID=UPI00397EABA1